jgi:hypothetical protein
LDYRPRRKDNFEVKKQLVFLLFLFFLSSFGQNGLDVFFKQSDTLNTSRKIPLQWKPSGHRALVGLNQLWYADYADLIFILSMIIEWLQMDKAGHIYSSYHLGRLGLKCSNGVELSKEQLIFGSGGICFFDRC